MPKDISSSACVRQDQGRIQKKSDTQPKLGSRPIYCPSSSGGRSAWEVSLRLPTSTHGVRLPGCVDVAGCDNKSNSPTTSGLSRCRTDLFRPTARPTAPRRGPSSSVVVRLDRSCSVHRSGARCTNACTWMPPSGRTPPGGHMGVVQWSGCGCGDG